MNCEQDEGLKNKFMCEYCNYIACDKYNYNRHLNTTKHIKNKIKINNEISQDCDINDKTLSTNKYKEYKCKCGKIYKHQPNLTRHKKTNCKYNLIGNIETSKNEKKFKETILKLIYENIKLKQQISELIQ